MAVCLCWPHVIGTLHVVAHYCVLLCIHVSTSGERVIAEKLTGFQLTKEFLHCLYLLTYLLTPWSRVLEKLTGLQLVKKFPAFYGTQRFSTVFTSARHLSLS